LKAFHHGGDLYFVQRQKLPVREVLRRLKDAGWTRCPAAGQNLQRACARIICDHKIDGNEWLQIARAAHELGLNSNCTMLYGHVETEEDRVDHLVRLRSVQDETRGFVTFIPLAFHLRTALEHLRTTTGFDDLKTLRCRG
jgi:aminodeoxyfutalosine synthase